MSFFEFWMRTKERGALLRKANQQRLNQPQLSRLLGDREVRVTLQKDRMASLLPPVGTEVFRRFTPGSMDKIQQRHKAEEEEHQKRKSTEATEDIQAPEDDFPKPDTHLEAGKPLPFIYGDPPPELLMIPLEELDPFYQSKKTFLVLSKGHIIYRFNAESSCYLLSPFNPLRTIAIKILIHPLFSLFMLLTILTNCMFMKVNSPVLTRAMGYVFTTVYTAEALLKVVSRGFCVGRFTFLRDAWNWLDIAIISTAFLAEFVDLGKCSVLMTIPRVMKIFSVSPGLKKTVEALIQSVKRLGDVIILMMFCLSIMTLIALQLFMGSLKNKCVVWPPGSLISDVNETGSGDFDFYQYISRPENHYFLPHHVDPLLCGNFSDAGVCPEGHFCLKGGRNPQYGYSNYDSFGGSLLSMLRLLTGDACHDLLHMTLRVAGKSYISVFVLVFLPGYFFMLSLVVAVVAMAVAEQEDAGAAESKQREEEFSRIVEVLKRREEEEEQDSSRVALSDEQDSPQMKNPAAVIESHEQERVTMEDGEQERQPSCCVFVEVFLKGNCCGCWRWLKQRLQPFVMNPFFDLGIVVCIILNTLFMAMEHYPMTAEMEELLATAHLVFTGIFIAEMILKLMALSLYGYFQVSWNIFDFIVVVSQLVALTLADVEGLSVMRSFRVLWLLRLARWWPAFHMWMRIVWSSVRSSAVVLLIMVFLFNVVGMQLFQEDYKDHVCRISDDCQLPRWHMHDSIHTFLLIFRILCGEWIETMFDCMEVSDRSTCVIFFVVVLIIGNLLVLNLFLTLLLSSFTHDQLVAEKGKNNLENRTWIPERIWTLLGKRGHSDPDHRVDAKKGSRKEYLALTLVTSDQPGDDGNHDNLTSGTAPCRAPIAEAETESKMPENEEEIKQQGDVVQKDENQKRNEPENCCCNSCYRCCPFLDIDTSRSTGRVWSNFRRVCLIIAQHKYFEVFIIITILLSSAALMFEDVHLQHHPVRVMVLDRADLVFIVLFLVEMLLKWMAFGLKKYFSSFWCWLDFLVLDVSLLSVVLGWLGYSSRPLRVFRTLRILSRFQGMRVVLRALLVSVPCMVNVLLVALHVWLIFSIMGVNLFAGKFFHCVNDTTEETFSVDQVDNKTQCALLIMENSTEVRWKNQKFNFDNVQKGYLSLFLLATSRGWLDILYSAVDSRQVESQPLYESNLYMILFFICFIIFGCFFTFNFFITAFVETLHLQRHKFGGKHVFITEEQQKYCQAMRRLLFKKPEKPAPRPQNQCQARLFDLVTALPFEIFIVVVICLNAVVMMVETHDQSFEKEFILYWFQFSFIVIFLIEFFLKIIALRQHYFSSKLNILDFLVLIVLIAGLFIADLIEKYFISPPMFAVARLVRIGPILRLIRYAKRIRMLLLGFMMSLPALFNIGLLLFFIVFTFSSVGMFTFAYVKGAMIDDVINFETFWSSMVSLITVTISSRWDSLLSPIMNTPPDCDPNMTNMGWTVTGNCVNPVVGILFFTSYIVLFFLLVVHMFIAVILETFNTQDLEDPEGSKPLSDTHLQMFYKTWRKFDPDASQVIPYSDLSDFCNALQDPLRIPKPNTLRLVHMDLPLLPGEQIHCWDILRALTVQLFGESEPMDSLKARLDEKFPINNPSKVSYEPISSTLQRKQEDVAAAVIQRAYRKHLLQDGGAEEAVGGASGVSGDSGSSGLGGASQ